MRVTVYFVALAASRPSVMLVRLPLMFGLLMLRLPACTPVCTPSGPHTFSLLRAVPPTPGGGSSPKYTCSLRVAPLGLLSPLHLAATKHNAAAVRHLVAAGAWVQHAGPTGETALELAQRHATEGAAARVLAPAAAAGGASEALTEARAQTLRELRWLPAVRTLWCVVAGAEPSGARGACPLRKLTRDALRLVCAAVVAAHLPEAEGVDEAEEPEEACRPGRAEHGGERSVRERRAQLACHLPPERRGVLARGITRSRWHRA